MFSYRKAIAVLLIMLLSSCAGQMRTYCEKNYLDSVLDTTYVPVKVITPKDSIVYRFVNKWKIKDTTIENERTILRIENGNKDTVYVFCGSKGDTNEVQAPKATSGQVAKERPPREWQDVFTEIPWFVWLIVVLFLALAVIRKM